MAQFQVTGGGSQALTASDVAIVRIEDIEWHKVTVTAAAAATLTLTRVNGFVQVATNAAVTVAVAN